MINSAYKIKPSYVQVAAGPGMPKDIWNKWYCYYRESIEGLSIARYMSPTGWQPSSYYFDSKREAELAFVQHGWKSLPVTTQEIRDARMMRDDCRHMMELEEREMERDTWESARGYDREEWLS